MSINNYTMHEFRNVKDLVKKILAYEDRARNDDKWLTYRVMQHFTNIYIPFQDFKKIPAFETVKRVRALIQNKEGLFIPTDDKVRYLRNQRKNKVKEFLKSEASWL